MADTLGLGGRMASKSLLRTSSLYATSDFAERGIGLVMLPVYAYTLSPAEFGLLALVQTLTALGSAVLGLGLFASLVRHFHNPPRGRASSDVIGVIWPMLVTVPGTVVVVLAVAGEDLFESIAGSLDFSDLVLPALMLVALNVSGVELSLAVARTREQPLRYAAITLSRAVLTAALITWFLVVRDAGAVGAVRAQVVATTVVWLGCAAWLWRQARPHWDGRLAVDLLRFGVPLIPQSVSTWALRLQDRLFLDRLVDSAAVGIYAMTYRLSSPLQVLMEAGHSTLTPRFSAAANDERLRGGLRVAIGQFVAAGFAFTIAFVVVAEPFVRVVLPVDYALVADAAPYVLPAVLVTSLFRLANSASVFYAGRRIVTLALTLTGVGLNATLNLVLIPPLGIVGAAVAALGTFTVLAAIAWWLSPLPELLRGMNEALMRIVGLGICSVAGVCLMTSLLSLTSFVVWGTATLAAYSFIGWRILRPMNAVGSTKRDVLSGEGK